MDKHDIHKMVIISGLLASNVRFKTATQDAVIECITHHMSEPRTLAHALEHLTQLGFTEDIARHAYSVMIQDGDLTLRVENGVPVLARNA